MDSKLEQVAICIRRGILVGGSLSLFMKFRLYNIYVSALETSRRALPWVLSLLGVSWGTLTYYNRSRRISLAKSSAILDKRKIVKIL